MVGGSGILSKVIMKLAKKSAHAAGSKGQNIVSRDMKAADKILEERLWKGTDFPSYHAKKLHDLATTDSGVARSWVEELIKGSKTQEELQVILGYLNDTSKTINLTPAVRKGLIKAANLKMTGLHFNNPEVLEKLSFLLEHLKNHGDDFL